MPYGITQCYLPPGSGDIPALTGYIESAEQSRTAEHFWLAAWCHVIKFRILPFRIWNMALKVNVIDLEYEEVLSILASQQYTVCEKLTRPRAGEVQVCLNTEECLFLTSFWCFLLLIRYNTSCHFSRARKPAWVSLIYRTEPTTKKCKNTKKTESRKQIWSEITVSGWWNTK